ncbi:FecCD family ABC transporter permease [Aureibacillus halotolerans]|uniref:Iron complex transport system permease protein n=1 Tax=Aureibacillus halotolerans TaxID=1508390 RepID=A0A4R6TWE6_9BACI|nr:iron ABC transporter permease [Aureibacillus halotolerans]TDQ36573.1 iron complex transport system permease protein [Aureibacillus halotolerans]
MKHAWTYRSKKGALSFQTPYRSIAILLGLFLLLIGSVFAGGSLGETIISPLDVLSTIVGTSNGEHDFILMTLRLPRTIVALLVGMALGLAGALLQSMVRNPLASPDILGVTAGASFAAVAFLSLSDGRFSIAWLPVAAVFGALATSVLLYLLSWKNGLQPIRLVLIGIGLSAVLGAGTTFFLVMGDMYTASQVYVWLTGTVYGATWDDVLVILFPLLLCLPFVLILARSLAVQELGEDVAKGLGNPVQVHRVLLLLLSIILAGVAVAVAGAIGFIGLLAPHIARRWLSFSFTSMVISSAFIGGLLMFGADMIARNAFYPLDVPAGVFTASIGAPFFLILLFRHRNRMV